jgi:hypothetical protein
VEFFLLKEKRIEILSDKEVDIPEVPAEIYSFRKILKHTLRKNPAERATVQQLLSEPLYPQLYYSETKVDSTIRVVVNHASIITSARVFMFACDCEHMCVYDVIM